MIYHRDCKYYIYDSYIIKPSYDEISSCSRLYIYNTDILNQVVEKPYAYSLITPSNPLLTNSHFTGEI